MKDNSSKQLRSQGGRLNENLVAWQRTREADEKLCRLIRKPGRLDDEKPETGQCNGGLAIYYFCLPAACGRLQ